VRLTFVMVVPATRVELLYSDGWRVDIEQTINAIQLPPGQRVTQHLTCFLYVELTCSQESQDVTIFRYLDIIRTRGQSNLAKTASN